MKHKTKYVTTPTKSPAQKTAGTVKKKYQRGYRKSPGKLLRIREALTEIENNNLSVRKAAKLFGLTESLLRRRRSGEVGIDSRNGPNPVFTNGEEAAMAKWLSEMAKRGMGLGPSEFLDFVQELIKRDKRKTVFKNDRPSYTWYYNFMARNSHLVETRKESSLENSRAKVSSKSLDEWFNKYYQFVSSLHLLDKPCQVYNADESGFSMGSKASKIIGPCKQDYQSNLPHVSGNSKKRLTAMFCANAEGEVIPPFLIYPAPKPTSYDPLIGSKMGTVIEYTEKGWMTAKVFYKFLQHFDRFASKERPVVLLIDSVSSHVDLDVFTFAKEKNIEIYRLLPNSTHFLQPLDYGVFGPLKKAWYKIVRQYTRQFPGKTIDKELFAGKLHEAFTQFYKPLTVINSFKSTGIFPVNRSQISENQLKPGLTFQLLSSNDPSSCSSNMVSQTTPQVVSQTLCQVISQIPSIDIRQTSASVVSQTSTQIAIHSSNTEVSQPSHDILVSEIPDSVVSPSFSKSITGLSLLASVALSDKQSTVPIIECSTENDFLSPVLKESLVYPVCAETSKSKRKSSTEQLPDCLTSSESIRKAALKQLETVKKFARKELMSKKKYLRDKEKQLKSKSKAKSSQQNISVPSGSVSGQTRVDLPKNNQMSSLDNETACSSNINKCRKSDRKRPARKALVFTVSSVDKCSVCGQIGDHVDGLGWVQCDLCDLWTHISCIPPDHDFDKHSLTCEDIEYFCHLCIT